jgi:hypothetical protein
MKKLFLIILSVLLMSLILGCSKLGNPSPDTTLLAVSSVTPLNNATHIAVNSTISVTFNKSMNTTSAEGAFTISGGITGEFSWSGNTMIFTPDHVLDYNTVYTCTVGTGAEDTTGTALASTYTWSFTTVYSNDTTAPTISSVTPANNDINVATLPTISVTFSEAMNTSSAQNAFTMVALSAKTVVSGIFNWGGNIMTFAPGTALATNTTYTCNVDTGAQDLTGN